MNIFGYTRVSGVGQSDKDGPVRQEEAIQAFAAAHCLNVLHIFSETISGTVESMDRPVFGDMLAKIQLYRRAVEEQGDKVSALVRVDAIVVERMDRLARELMVSELLLSECRKLGVKVFCADQTELVDMASSELDPTRTLFRQIMGAIAQWEKTVIVHKLRAARLRIRREKNRCEGKRPYGTHTGEQEILLQMKLMRTHDESWTAIASALNRRGYRTRHGKVWTKYSVRDCYSGRKKTLVS